MDEALSRRYQRTEVAMSPLKVCCWTVLVLLVVCQLAARGAARRRTLRQPDLLTAASGHQYGRVQMKVYRGPNDHGHEHFAPHGYWVRQPADDRR